MEGTVGGGGGSKMEGTIGGGGSKMDGTVESLQVQAVIARVETSLTSVT